MRRNIVTIAIVAAMLCCASLPLEAADIQVNPPGPVFQFPVLAWGNTSATALGFNNNFWFSPLSQNESVCVYIVNNNPGSGHAFNASIVITPNPQEATPSDNKWMQTAFISTTAVSTGAPTPVPAGLGTQVSGAALVAIKFSASAVAGGSPDTANVFLIQTQGSCFGGQSFTNSNTQTVFSAPPILAVSDGLGQAFESTATTTNPAANVALLAINNSTSSRNQYYDRAVVTTGAAAATILITAITTSGSTCTTPAILTLNLGAGSVTATASVQTACTTQPGTNPAPGVTYIIPANSTVTIDLTGYIGSSSSTNGIEILNSAAITSVVNAAIYWHEK